MEAAMPRTTLLAVLFASACSTAPTLGSSRQALQPAPVLFTVDAKFTNFIASLTFTETDQVSGGVLASGTGLDSPAFQGNNVDVHRTLTTDGGQIFMHIEGTFVAGAYYDPASCVGYHQGQWQIDNATGEYAGLQGTGTWHTWVTHDCTTGAPLTAHEENPGDVHFVAQ
jgi:hypothetical protein